MEYVIYDPESKKYYSLTELNELTNTLKRKQNGNSN